MGETLAPEDPGPQAFAGELGFLRRHRPTVPRGSAGGTTDALRAAPSAPDPERARPVDHRGPKNWISQVLLHQGAPDSSEVVASWKPVAAGGVIAVGGALIVALGLAGQELINILLIAGLTMLVAGFLDGTGRRYRGPGLGLTIVGIVPRLFDSAPWLQEGWAFGIFLLAYGAYVAVSRRRHPE